MRMYKEGYTAEQYNKDVDDKNNINSKIQELRYNLSKKDYSIYNMETNAMATQQWNLFIILGIITLIILLFTLKYMFS